MMMARAAPVGRMEKFVNNVKKKLIGEKKSFKKLKKVKTVEK